MIRLAYAAARVVMLDAYADVDHRLDAPGDAESIGRFIDWSATAALRRHIAAQGFGIAEAMDTAQRFQIGWANAARLIRACGELDLAHGFIAGAGVDHLPHVGRATDLVDGVVHQVEFIQAAGGWPILLPMPWLTANRAAARDYVDVYGAIFRQCRGPLFVHWLGEMFLPALRGYFPEDSFARVMALEPEKVRGCKLSLLDAALETRIRAELLPRDQIVLTGDDFHFADLIAGEAIEPDRYLEVDGRRLPLGRFSHALLGVLDGVAVPAGRALHCLAAGDLEGYERTMRACERYGQVVFEAPTAHYKAGLAFTAWLNGLQANPMLVNHEERARSTSHYLRVAEAAAACGALRSDAATVERLRAYRAGEQR